ncbi:MAG TPA: hypothetical protein VFS20_29780 [Longimicrobium sp.]|nr:hypothetical protein [Longimicrobium sp.]
MLTLFAIQSVQRATIDVSTVVVVAFAVAVVALVLWASRPSVIARYSAARKAGDVEKHPATPEEPSGGRYQTR